jgi:hypothetical protein
VDSNSGGLHCFYLLEFAEKHIASPGLKVVLWPFPYSFRMESERDLLKT